MKPTLVALTLAVALAAALASCAPQHRALIVTPSESFSTVSWTADERAQEVAFRTLKTTPESSDHLIRLNRSEKPHVHDTHDIAVFITKGRIRFHWKDRVCDLRAGDVIEIPRGIVHWGEKVTDEPPEAFAVITPPFDGKDKRDIIQ